MEETPKKEEGWGEVIVAFLGLVALALLVVSGFWGVYMSQLALEDARYERCVRHYGIEEGDEDYTTISCHDKHYAQYDNN